MAFGSNFGSIFGSNFGSIFEGDTDTAPVPTAYFNGADTTGFTFTGGPTYATDNLGVLRTAGVNLLSAQGMRLDGVEWKDTNLDGSPIVPIKNQRTRTSITALTGEDLGAELGTGSFTGWSINGEPGSNITAGVFNLINSASKHTFGFKLGVGSAGKTYKITFNIDSISGGDIGVRFTTSGLNNFVSGTGPKEYTIVYAGTGTIEFFCSVTGVNASLSGVSVKEVLPSFTSAFTPSTTYKKYLRPNPLTMPGYLCEPARTNKCTCRKANPTDTTGINVFGGATVTRVLDTSELALAKLDVICNSMYVYEAIIPNAGYLLISGAANSAYHSVSFLMRKVSGDNAIKIGLSAGLNSIVSITTGYTKVLKENILATGTQETIIFNHNVASITVRFILPQLEEGAFCTSPIINPSDALGSATRAGTVLSYPTAGKIRSNDIAFRMMMIPGVATTAHQVLFDSRLDASNSIFSLYFESNKIWTYSQNSGVWDGIGIPYAIVQDIPVEVILTKSSVNGIIITFRTFSGTWSTFAIPANKTSSQALSNMGVGTSYFIGNEAPSGAQFTGNILEFDTLLIPPSVTDPLSYAKAKWRLPA